MIDPRDHPSLWLLMRCVGATDAWTDPSEDPDVARCDRVTSWVTAVCLLMVLGAIVGATITEVLRTWA